jgi:hypothetical protein
MHPQAVRRGKGERAVMFGFGANFVPQQMGRLLPFTTMLAEARHEDMRIATRFRTHKFKTGNNVAPFFRLCTTMVTIAWYRS